MSEELTENDRKRIENDEDREDINEAPKKKAKLASSLIDEEAADSDSDREKGDDNESDVESEKDEYEKDGCF